MSHKVYKLNFTFKHSSGDIRTLTRTILAEDEGEAFAEATRIKEENSDVDCKFTGFEEVKQGRIWKVTMDAFDMYDAEQVAYRIWEKQVTEEGWTDISIFRTLVDVPKAPMTDKEVA